MKSWIKSGITQGYPVDLLEAEGIEDNNVEGLDDSTGWLAELQPRFGLVNNVNDVISWFPYVWIKFHMGCIPYSIRPRMEYGVWIESLLSITQHFMHLMDIGDKWQIMYLFGR
jgi:hypothetical protein